MSNHQQELINNSLGIHLRMVMDENKKFRLQLKAVRELHKTGKAYLDDQPMCIHCRTVEYPCPTIKALDGVQE
jgi:hypothetical protein